MTLVRCPNCRGLDSSRWPFGPCTVCKGTGKVTTERAAPVLAAIKERNNPRV